MVSFFCIFALLNKFNKLKKNILQINQVQKYVIVLIVSVKQSLANVTISSNQCLMFLSTHVKYKRS